MRKLLVAVLLLALLPGVAAAADLTVTAGGAGNKNLASGTSDFEIVWSTMKGASWVQIIADTADIIVYINYDNNSWSPITVPAGSSYVYDRDQVYRVFVDRSNATLVGVYWQ